MKKLIKSQHNKVLFGVCGGLGETFNIDPVVIRLLFIVGTIFTGSLLFWIYLILGLILPTGEQ